MFLVFLPTTEEGIVIEKKVMQINQCFQAYADEPPLEKRPLRYIHFNNNLQNITMDLCLEKTYQTLAITIEINKPVSMSEIQPLCLYVLASQSSHDYTQYTYGPRRQDLAPKTKVSKQ